MQAKVYSFLLTILTTIYGNAQMGTATDVFDMVRQGKTQEIALVLKSNPRAFQVVNSDGFTPLIIASYRGQVKAVQMLIDGGVLVNHVSPMGTALTAAVFKGYTDITEILLKNKADANLPDEQGNTPLMIACQFKNETLVKLLLQYGALKDLKNKSGQTAFEMAVLSENQSIVNLLKQ